MNDDDFLQDISTSDTVIDVDTLLVSGDVSNSDVNTVTTQYVEVSNFPDYVPYFDNVTGVLNIILFVLLFEYLERKIKHICYLFMGKGKNNE